MPAAGHASCACALTPPLSPTPRRRHQPDDLKTRPLRVVDETINTSSRVEFTVYNEQGYQFTVATQRPHWLSWVSPFRVDPSRLTLHKMDKLDAADSVYIRTKFMQVRGGGLHAAVHCGA
jgi:hypothetical protein